MADGTKIEWTDATWNPVRASFATPEGPRTGWHCEHVSEGCRNCYAEAINRRLGTGFDYKPGHLVHTNRFGERRGDVSILLDEKMLLRPLQWRRPRKIFVGSMTDLFADFVRDEWLDRIFAVMALAPQHVFQVLTKRPERMRAYVSEQARGGRYVTDEIARILAPLPGGGYDTKLAKDREQFRVANRRCSGTPWSPLPLPNVWLGVSVEDQQRADERIPILLDSPAAVRWLSMEPLLGPVNIHDALWAGDGPPEANLFSTIDWVVLGGESGSGARPMHPDWARSVRDQCGAADVPFLFKQWGEWLPWEPDQMPLWKSQNGQLIDRHHMPDMDSNEDPRSKHWTDACLYDGDDICVHSKVGKKLAGRLLDGVQHDGMPA